MFAVVDVEVGLRDHKVHDIGAIKSDNSNFHKASREGLLEFIKDVHFICGHNIVHHDAKYLFSDKTNKWILVDTLYMSPLLFPERPYHKLVKDDKLVSDQVNNPVNDCEKAKELLLDEITKWEALPETNRRILAALLGDKQEFNGFFRFVGFDSKEKDVVSLIKNTYQGSICSNADLATLVRNYPCELAYALALIDTVDHRSITPGWVLRNYPEVEYVMRVLRNVRCKEGCPYCQSKLDIYKGLNKYFGYDKFRTFEGENLQEAAVEAAVMGKSLLSIFPTGGGKSLTFQLPALMEGEAIHGLTVVISPLQSLMKDQVDNLADKGITDAVTINGLLDPISRAFSIKRVQDGEASLLYISPEMLRSKTIERILLSRNVVRFVIDEAHCFSSWGQDFRVDYLYIGKFIKDYQSNKGLKQNIPVSCFTATAKQKVIQDISDYFHDTLGLTLELFASTATRTNLRYSVIHAETHEEKYTKLRTLISEFDCPTIVYVSRTKKSEELASRLTRDGYEALPYNGKMDSDDKIANQESFMNDRVRIIVATSAFGMGVDKKDVGLVIHYDISDSLENYVQEAGRAGRDPSLQARCYVLYSDNDLDKHFILLNQTKLSISEIQQVWKAVKDMTKQRKKVTCSALEIARQAGWDDSVYDIETRVKTALSALEQSGYIQRGNNVPQVFATGITVKNMDEARERITRSVLFEKEEVEKATRIIKSLISQKYISRAQDAEAESRVDYLADMLGLSKRDVISAVERMRQEGILADSRDMTAYLRDTGASERKSKTLLDYYSQIERFILGQLHDDTLRLSCKQLNDDAIKSGIEAAKEKDIKTLLYFLTVQGYIQKKDSESHIMEISRRLDEENTMARFEKRIETSAICMEWLYKCAAQKADPQLQNSVTVQFSVLELLNYVKTYRQCALVSPNAIDIKDIEESLLYLSKIGAIKLEGGFLVLYNALEITRLKDNKYKYSQDDYKMLNDFYKQKIQQVHIVGEFANLMVEDYDAALQYVQDYFQMDYRKFVAKYFKGERISEIQRNLTPQKYEQIFGQLSERQMGIISDKESRCIVVAAGPGSGKTRVLVHKLASLLLLEDVKHEQLLMLTFSRAAATEFKQRLLSLIGNAAHFVEIKTFHAYSFDLLGRVGNLDEVQDVVQKAAIMISQGEVEPSKIGKTVLVIDEAQDMGTAEQALVRALMEVNEEMRVIAVGDDDQNIFEFRGANSRYMSSLSSVQGGRFVEMVENYRSARHVVSFSNSFVSTISGRLKTNPIVSRRPIEGSVEVVKHTSQYMYEPLVASVMGTQSDGSKCVLTQTNEEAIIIVALLRKKGVNCQLIQSMEGFKFSKLAEVKYFNACLKKKIAGPMIPEDVWAEAKEKTFSKYRSSECLPYIKRCVELFEETNRSKYYGDFKEYLYESSIEDFYNDSGEDVVVSTIHKAKGREYDDVYMLVSNSFNDDNKRRRQLYVGMTRARNRLYIHTNGEIFNSLYADRFHIDSVDYTMPEEVAIQLSHKDVVLDFFKNKKTEILSLVSGSPLIYRDNYLINPCTNRAVAHLSKSMQDKLEGWGSKGYVVERASVRFIVAWRPKDASVEEQETAVLLADLVLANKQK